MNKKNNDYYDKKIDIGLKKKELTEKFGAHFGGNGEELPPEIEGAWLNYVEEFEKQHANAQRTTVWEYMGKPSYKTLDKIKAEEVSPGLHRLFELLQKHNIALDVLCEVEDRELYRFVTEELFQHEMDDIGIPGMTCHFIYEEFHPNAGYDIEQSIDYFFRMTMGKMENIGGDGYDILYVDEKNFKGVNGDKIEENKVVEDINNFLDSFDSFEIDHYAIKSLYINEEETNSEVLFTIHYKGMFEGSHKTCDFNGEGCFKLKPSEYGGWGIYYINMPGLRIG